MRYPCFAVPICLVLLGQPVSAASFHDEAIQGDLSGDRLNPTQHTLSAGTNSLLATTGFEFIDDEVLRDREYLRVDLPDGHELTHIYMQSYDLSYGVAFIGVQEGTTITFDPGDAFSNVGNLLGWAHFGPSYGHQPGFDLLPEIAIGQGAIGFDSPLAGPSYTFWIQQTEDPVTYQLDFIVEAVPEPATWAMLLIGAGLMLARRNRRW